MTRILSRRAGAIAAAVLVLACGTVPTFSDNIASISAIELPSLVVIGGDVLRDSNGVAAPLKVEAFDIAGKNLADSRSRKQAMLLAARVAATRREKKNASRAT